MKKYLIVILAIAILGILSGLIKLVGAYTDSNLIASMENIPYISFVVYFFTHSRNYKY